MALIEMDFATGIGEHYEEIVLWENSNPSTYISSQLITLSDDYTQYNLIKVVFKCASSGADDSKRYIRNVYQTPEDIQNTQNAVNYACAGFGRRGSSTSICDFIGIGTSNTNVNYYHLDTANLIIPLYIYGIKKVGGSGDNNLVIICPNQIISDKTLQTKYTLNFNKSISSGDYLLFKIYFPDNSDSTKYSTKVLQYTGSGSYSINSVYTSTSSPVTLNCTLTDTSITLTGYSGSFQNIYMEIYDANPLFS